MVLLSRPGLACQIQPLQYCSNLTKFVRLCYNSHAMSQSGNNEHQPLKSISTSMPVIALGGQIGCITLVLVLVAAFGGIWLDNILGTKPLLTIILVLGAAPLSLYLTYMMAVRAINKVNLPMHQDTKNETLKEDETSE